MTDYDLDQLKARIELLWDKYKRAERDMREADKEWEHAYMTKVLEERRRERLSKAHEFTHQTK